MAYTPKTNWKKGEVLEADDMNRVEQGVSDLYTRLDTTKTSDLTLQAGTKTVTATRSVPFNVLSLTGRLLLNLLGRAGTFDSITGWTSTGGTSAVGTTNALYGTTALFFTLSGASGRVSRSVATVSGSRYLAAVEVRLGTAIGAYVSVTGASNGATVSSTTGYMITYVPFTATAATTDIGVTITGANGQTAYIDGFRVYELSSTEYTAIAGMTVADVAARFPYTEGLAGVRNPYAIRWTSNSKTEVAALLAFDTELLSAPASDTEADTIQQGADGQYYRTFVWNKMELTGALNWRLLGPGSDYITALVSIPKPVKDTGIVIKYDGKILTRFLQNASIPGPDAQVVADDSESTTSNPNVLGVTIANTDSGWSSYSPTADEIKAYFYGWVMGTQSNGAFTVGYNGSGTKAWRGIVDDNGSGTTNLPTVYFREQYSQPSWQPYQLLFKRASAVRESISSEGALNLVQGDNVIEVGSGLILRESVKPQLATPYYFINGATTASSALGNKVRSILKVYRDGREDRNWETVDHTVAANQTNFGLKQSRLFDYLYSMNSIYTVSYFTQALYPATSFVGNIPTNERAMLDSYVRDMQQALRRISVTEMKKLDQDYSVWLTPTLLNSWVNKTGRQSLQYRKKDGVITIRGEIKSGVIGAAIFKLPDGYRPKATAKYPVNCWSGSAVIGASLIIYPTGEVIISDGNNNEIGLGSVVFSTD